MSYRKTHVKSKVRGIRPKKSIFKKFWFWFIFLCVAIIISAVYTVLFCPVFQIENVEISGNQKIAAQDIKNIANEDINKKIFNLYGWSVISRSFFLINTAEIKNNLLDRFPAIESVEINKKMFRSVNIDIAERAPIAIFCPLSADTPQETCYLMDNSGVIFEPISVLPQGTTVISREINGGQLLAGENVIQQDVINILIKLKKSLQDNFQADIKEALFSGPMMLDVKTDENWHIYLDLSEGSDVNLELAKLNLLLTGGISPEERKNLRYIDLRPKDRAIICDNDICGK